MGARARGTGAQPKSRPRTLITISFSKICVCAVEMEPCTFPISFWIVRYVFSSVSNGLPPCAFMMVWERRAVRLARTAANAQGEWESADRQRTGRAQGRGKSSPRTGGPNRLPSR